MRTVQLTKYAFRIRTRLGLVIENVMIHGDDMMHAQRKLRQIHPRCEILECICHRGGVRVPVDVAAAAIGVAMR